MIYRRAPISKRKKRPRRSRRGAGPTVSPFKRFFNTVKAILKRYFLTGLLVFVPLYLTFQILKFLIGTMDEVIYRLPYANDLKQIPGLGVITTILVLLLIGAFAHNYIGRKVIAIGDRLLGKIPLVRSIYKGLKQITETFFFQKGGHLRRVVIIQYPREGIYSLAFVTGVPRPSTQKLVGRNLISVFVPTTPNPTSGFFLMVPREDAIPLDITVEEAFKIIISGGMVDKDGTDVSSGVQDWPPATT